MKIAMIGQKGFPARSGGVEKHVDELSRRLARQGHEVIVFCRSWYSNAELPPPLTPPQAGGGFAPVRILTPSLRTKHLDAISHTFFSILKASLMKADVFHIHGVGPALLCWLPRLLRPGAKVVVTFHCLDREHEKWNFFARAMLRLGEFLACRVPDATITVSKTLADYCRRTYGVETRYIPNGVTPVEATPPNLPLGRGGNAVLDRFGLIPFCYLLMLSRLVRHKGVHTLITAWKTARELRPDVLAGFRLAIVGGGAFTDDYVDELATLAAGDDSIVLTGEQYGEPLRELLSHAYAGVHPSVSEGMPISVLEMMSHGKCVLASDIPEHLELTEKRGLNFRAGDVRDLAEKIIMMLEAPQQTAQVGREAAEFVTANFNWDEAAEQTAALYEELAVSPTASLLPVRKSA